MSNAGVDRIRVRILAALELGCGGLMVGCGKVPFETNTSRANEASSSANTTIAPAVTTSATSVNTSAGPNAPPDDPEQVVPAGPSAATPASSEPFSIDDHSFVAGSGYRFSRITVGEAAQLCDLPSLTSSLALLFCVPPSSVDASCTTGITPEEVYRLARAVYSCGLGFTGHVQCGPLESTSLSTSATSAGGTPAPEAAAEAPPPDAASLPFPVKDAAPPTDGALATDAAARDCCWVLTGGCAIGRPFTVDGRARRALLQAGRQTWGRTLSVKLDDLLVTERESLMHMWLEEARSEHASVASFARFTLECLAVGAPAELVHLAQQATREEIEHAQTAFGMAAAYGAESLAPGPLSLAGALDNSGSLNIIALSVAKEGCIAETVSALLLAEASEAATEPTVKAALAQIAEEELRHAELAWRFLAWSIANSDRDLSSALTSVFQSAAQYVGFGSLSVRHGSQRLRSHGCLSTTEQQRISETALSKLIAPLASQLLRPMTERCKLSTSTAQA